MDMDVPMADGALAQSRDENWEKCRSADTGAADAHDVIAGCTTLIQSRRETAKDLAVAFRNRGLGYILEKQYELAIRDLNQAIRLDPGDSTAAARRGFGHLGEYPAQS